MLKSFFCIAAIFCLTTATFGQIGIYTENDIELQDLFIEAQLEKHKGNTDKQIELLDEVIRRNRRSHAAYFELAKAYMEKDNPELAEKNINKALEIDQSVWYLQLLKSIYDKTGRHTESITVCDSMIVRLSDNRQLMLDKAYHQLEAGLYPDAVNTLLEIQLKSGPSEEISKKLFEIHNSNGNTEEAVKSLKTLSDHFPGNVRFLNNLAGYLYENGRKQEALEYYNKVLKIEPDNPTASFAVARENSENSEGTPLHRISSLLDNDNIALDDIIKELMPFMSNMTHEGEQTELLKAISQKLVDKYPDEAKTHSVRADILFYAGDLAASEKHYEKAISIDDSKYTLWDQWLINLWEIEEYEKMEEAAMNSIELFPNQAGAFIYYSMAVFENNQRELVEEYLDEASLIAGNNPVHLSSINIFKTWMKKDDLANDMIASTLGKLDERHILSPVLMEMTGDLYHSISDPANTRKYWKKAINYGADRERINRKIGMLN